MESVVKDFWHRRNVFVSGATGLLGSWLLEELLRRGANATILVRDWVPESLAVTSGGLARANVVRGELEDPNLILRTLNEYEVDTVFHLGAQAIVGVSSRSPVSTFESNIRGTWNVLEACRALPKLVKRVIVASSDKAYGSHEVLPYTEQAPLQGRFPYDVSKSCADLISFSYYYTYQVPVAITRCGNLFGGGDLNFNRLIPGTIRSAWFDEAPLIRSDGKFVKDAVQAYLQLAEHLPDERFVGQAFNFGPERPLSVIEVVNMILSLMGKTHLQPVILNEASHEILRQYLDCSKARQWMGWQPASTFEDGLRETIDWYRTFFQRQQMEEPA